MGNKMLIDATHPEETRVVVTRGNRVEEFDYEFGDAQTAPRKYLSRQNCSHRALLAGRFRKLRRKPPWLLAFAEIHPDYYQIPVAVREAIMKEDALDRQRHAAEGDNGHSAEAGHKDDGAAGTGMRSGGSRAFSVRRRATATGEETAEASPVEAAAEETCPRKPRQRSRRACPNPVKRREENPAKPRYRSKQRCRP